MPSLLSKLRDVPLVFIDVETTGASTRWGDRVTEIAAARFKGGQLVTPFSQLVDPQRRIAPGVVALTGITQEMVTGQPTLSTLLDRLIELSRDSVIIGHNVLFDLSFIADEFRRAGRSFGDFLAGTHVVDTVRLARRTRGRRGNGLQRLAALFGVEVATAHRALADCLTTQAVMTHLLAPLGGLDMMLADVLATQGGAIRVAADPTPAQQLLPIDLEEALAQRVPVKIIYLDARNNRSERVVHPLRLREASGSVTLVAHCTLRNESRTFKVERIIELQRIE
ncbi:MAG: exonuclease domain-containing protein [Tepidisphaeraceae bacterium]